MNRITDVVSTEDSEKLDGVATSIRRLLETCLFEPEQAAALVASYEQVLSRLTQLERNEPRILLLVATKIIEIGQRGVRNQGRIAELIITELKM